MVEATSSLIGIHCELDLSKSLDERTGTFVLRATVEQGSLRLTSNQLEHALSRVSGANFQKPSVRFGRAELA